MFVVVSSFRAAIEALRPDLLLLELDPDAHSSCTGGCVCIVHVLCLRVCDQELDPARASLMYRCVHKVRENDTSALADACPVVLFCRARACGQSWFCHCISTQLTRRTPRAHRRDNEPEAGPPPSASELLSQVLADMQRDKKHDLLQALMAAMYKSIEGGMGRYDLLRKFAAWHSRPLSQRVRARSPRTHCTPMHTLTRTGQLGVKAGQEFTAARRAAESVAAGAGAAWEREVAALLEGLPGGGRVFAEERAAAAAAAAEQEQQQHQAASGSGSGVGGGGDSAAAAESSEAAPEAAAAAGDTASPAAAAAAASDNVSLEASPEPAAGVTRNPVSGIQIVLGDRPASDTLKAMWGALSPWRRLKFCWEVTSGMFEPVSGVQGVGARACVGGIPQP